MLFNLSLCESDSSPDSQRLRNAYSDVREQPAHGLDQRGRAAVSSAERKHGSVFKQSAMARAEDG